MLKHVFFPTLEYVSLMKLLPVLEKQYMTCCEVQEMNGLLLEDGSSSGAVEVPFLEKKKNKKPIGCV